MDEYIKKEDAIKHLSGECMVKYPLSYSNGISAAIKEIGKLPTADVVPKSEVDKLELTLQGVMWSVDKWLDEADYDADPIKRAITMREKTLQIVETTKAEVARVIFEEIEEILVRPEAPTTLFYHCSKHSYAELKKKYTEGNNEQR